MCTKINLLLNSMSDTDRVLLKLKMKRYFAQYEYLQNELVETEYLFDIYNKDFLKECYGSTNTETNTETNEKKESAEIKEKNEMGKSTSESNVSENSEDEIEVQIETNDDINLKKLYKMLSLKTHPDKNGGDQKMFIEVKQAYLDKDIFKLILIANKYNLDVPTDDIIDIELFEKSIVDMQTKISNLKRTVAWHWAQGDETKKEQIKARLFKK